MSSIDWMSLKKEADDATKPIPDGEYDIIVEKSELVISKQGQGNPMISVQMKVVIGPYSGRMLFSNIVFSTDKAFALAMWFRKLAAFGLDDAYFGRGPELPDIAASLVGRYATLTVGHREWNNVVSNDVTGFRPTVGAIQPHNLVVGGPAFTGTSASTNPTPSVPPVPGAVTPSAGVPVPTATPGTISPGPSTPPPVAF